MKILLLTASTGISLVLAEMVFRWTVRRERAAQVESYKHILFDFVGDKPYLYLPKQNLDLPLPIPQADGTIVEWQLRTNRYRCRGPDFDVDELDGRKRVLFVGDSYTFGYAVEESETFPFQIEKLLAETGTEAVAINAGVPGFNSVQESQYLPELLDMFAPDFVVVAYVMNDAEPPVMVPLEPEVVFARTRSWLFEEAKPLLNRLARLVVGDGELFAPQRVLSRESRGALVEGFAPDVPDWPVSKAAVGDMAKSCAERNIPFVVAILPSFVRLFDDTYPYGVIHQQVAAAGQELGFETIDVFHAFRGRDATRLSVPMDGHPNGEAHRLIAEYLIERWSAWH